MTLASRFRGYVVVILSIVAPTVQAEVSPRTVQAGNRVDFRITHAAISLKSVISLSRAKGPIPGEKISLSDGVATFEMTFDDMATPGEQRVLIKNGNVVVDVGYFVVLDKKGEVLVLSNARVGQPKLEKDKLTLAIQVDFDRPSGAWFSNLVAIRVPKTDKQVSTFITDLASHLKRTGGTLEIVSIIDKFKGKPGQSISFEIMVGARNPSNEYGFSPSAEGTFTVP